MTTTYEQTSLIDMAPLVRVTGATIDERFAEFHRLNPWVLRGLEALAESWVAAGQRRISVKALFEVLRYRYGVTTGDEWKLNNSYTSRYSRLLLDRRPEWAGHIETRRMPSKVAA